LQKDYVPPIDSSTFLAIASDFDLSSTKGLEEARVTLDELKTFAELEEQSGFDPSGSGGFLNNGDPSKSDSVYGVAKGSEGTDRTNFTRSVDSYGLETNGSSDTEGGIGQTGDHLTLEQKEESLNEMFPNLKAYDVKHALRKNRGDYERTAEELLSRVMMTEEGLQTNQLDAFAVLSNETNKGKRGKNKRKSKQVSNFSHLAGNTLIGTNFGCING
jgi:CUE domain